MDGVVIPSDVVTALLAAGGAMSVWTVVRSIIALRNSAESREDKAVARLERFEQECREQLAHEREWGAYWSRVAGLLSHAMATAGVDEPQLPKPPRRPEPRKSRRTLPRDEGPAE